MRDTATITELLGDDTRHCTTPFSGIVHEPITQIDSLPYHSLGGARFERLCYEILLSNGYEPRFFGRGGQAQHGVDLLAEQAGRTTVYQCKNLSAPPTSRELNKYLDRFEQQWLDEAGLPRPDRFVICCPALMRDSEADAQWLLTKASFERRTGVEAGLWHKDLLDAWLRKLPDVVADLFSDRHAEVFCDIDDWRADLFMPVRDGAGGDRRLRRYFKSRREGRLYIDEGRKQEILEALERSPVVMVQGLPGSGKTFTALAVAEGLRSSRQRAYFVDVSDDDVTKARLREGIRLRLLSRPSVFILENCQDDMDMVATALDSLDHLLKSRRSEVICLVRHASSPIRPQSDECELFLELDSLGAAIDFENTEHLLTRVIEFWRPTFVGLSQKRLQKLAALCGSDLYLLDELLTLIESPSEIDDLSPAEIYELVWRSYFARKTADMLPLTRRLAALAQFNIQPRADVLRVPADEQELLAELGVRVGRPPRWRFLHSTAAELALHTLWYGMGVLEPIEIAREAAIDIINYLNDIQDLRLRPPAALVLIEADLLRVLESGLKLMDRNSETYLKAAVVDSEPVRHLLGGAIRPRTIALCALVAHFGGAQSAETYSRTLYETLGRLLRGDDPRLLIEDLSQIAGMLEVLRVAEPKLHAQLGENLDAAALVGVIGTSGTIVDFYKIAEHAPASFARRLVDALTDRHIEQLIDQTIATGRSIGMLPLRLRKLRLREDGLELGQELERKIGVARLLRLTTAHGTALDLFSIIDTISTAAAREMIAALVESGVESVIARTIADSRSIGMLNFVIRKLKRRAESKETAEQLEQAFGARGFLRLIDANGVISDLFRMVAAISPDVARPLVDALDEAIVERLIARTIRDGQSIGTLHLSLRSLARCQDTMGIAKTLEQKIGPKRLLRLIEASGTVFELFSITECVSPSLARELVERLDEAGLERLIAKTVAAGRSISTLHLALRALHASDDTAETFQRLVQELGAARFLKLIEANGTVVELFKIVESTVTVFSGTLVDTLSESQIERLIDKTTAASRSIGTLNLSLRELLRRERTREIGEKLEKKFGPTRFLRLIEANGTLFELFMFIRDASPQLASGLVEALDDSRINRLLAKTIASGRSIGVFNLTLRDLHRRDGTAAIGRALEQTIGAKRLLELIIANGSIFELFMIIRDGSPALASGLVDALDGSGVEKLIDKAIVSGRSIGTLNFTLRDMRNGTNTALTGRVLEEKIGPKRFLRLIESNGSIFELFMIAKDSSPALARGLVDALDQSAVERLLAKTIAAGRSIGTLNFAIRSLNRREQTADIGHALEAKIGVSGFWRLVLGTGSPGALVSLLREFSPEFRQAFLAGASVISQEQWEQVLGRGDFFQLCELVSSGAALFDRDAGRSPLQAAIKHLAPRLVVTATWYQRNSGNRLLVTWPEATATASTSLALRDFLAQLDLQSLSFPTLRESVSAVELLYQRRADLRSWLVAEVRALLPHPRSWALVPREDMEWPKILLRVLASSAFADEDADYYVDGLMACFTPDVVAKCYTPDVLWTLWALFNLARTRVKTLGLVAFGKTLPLDFVRSLNENVAIRIAREGGVDEWRARFALVGLLSLLGFSVHSSVIARLRAELKRWGSGGARRLLAKQPFVTAWLMLQGIGVTKHVRAAELTKFRGRLLISAQESLVRDAATEYAYSCLRRSKVGSD